MRYGSLQLPIVGQNNVLEWFLSILQWDMVDCKLTIQGVMVLWLFSPPEFTSVRLFRKTDDTSFNTLKPETFFIPIHRKLGFPLPPKKFGRAYKANEHMAIWLSWGDLNTAGNAEFLFSKWPSKALHTWMELVTTLNSQYGSHLQALCSSLFSFIWNCNGEQIMYRL